MASATLIPPSLSQTSSPLAKVPKAPHFIASLSTSPHSYPKNQIFHSLTSIPQLGLASISSWNGLRRTGFSISLKSLRFEKRKKKVGKGVFASLFGVGAPEALVIGVVALLVFGPKGLADVAKNLGKTLRTFQPTIRELQEVSREFKSTLEKEIGIDELQNPLPRKPSNISTFSQSQSSPATTTETAAATTTTEDSQATPGTPVAATEDSQATPETPVAPVAVAEDSQATPETPVAVAEDSQATPENPVADTEESQANASPPAATTGDSKSQVVATIPAATTKGFDQ